MSHVAEVSCKWLVERLAYEAATLGFRIRGTNEMCSKRAMMDYTDLARTHLNPNPLLLFLLQAHVVTAFEQSLSNMTNRLQQLTATAERKDGELTDMRQTIELLRKQSILAIFSPLAAQDPDGHVCVSLVFRFIQPLRFATLCAPQTIRTD